MNFVRDPSSGLYLRPSDQRAFRGGAFSHGGRGGRGHVVSGGVSKPGGGAAVVQGGGGLPTGLVFASEWDSGTGTGNQAILDQLRTRPWLGQFGSGVFEVRTTSTDSRDYPTTYYVRNSMVSGGGKQIETNPASAGENYWATPGIGDSITVRWYERVTATYEGTDGSHPHYFNHYVTAPVQYAGSPFTMNYGDGDGASIEDWTATTFAFLVGNSQTVYFGPIELNKNQTYRIEIKYTRTGTNTYTQDIGIYDIAGTLLYDGGDLIQRGGSTALSDYETTDASSAAASEEARGWRMGTEGLAGAGTEPFSEISAVAICAGPNAAWPVGPYTSAEAAFTAP